jgi:flagellar export protein FliJ
MSARILLAGVLKVRKIREDMAKAEAAAAQAASYRAATDYARREAVLAGRPVPGTAEASSWLAIRAGLMGLASDAAAARELAEVRRAEATAAMARFAGARREREGVEDLTQRQLEAERREQEAAEQREADDRAAARSAADPTGEDLP